MVRRSILDSMTSERVYSLFRVKTIDEHYRTIGCVLGSKRMINNESSHDGFPGAGDTRIDRSRILQAHPCLKMIRASFYHQFCCSNDVRSPVH